MPKTATKATPKSPVAKSTGPRTTSGGASKASVDAPATLPASIVNALPIGAQVIEHVRAIEALLPVLTKELDKIAKSGSIPLARAFVVMHRLNDRMLSDEKAFKGYRALWKDLKSVKVPQAFEHDNVDSIPLSEGFRVGVSSNTYASIKAGKKEEAFTWLQETGKGDVISTTVNSSTLSALARELMEEQNIELPEELFNVAQIANTSVTKT